MPALIVKENPQLRRVERAIAELEAQPPVERLRRRHLILALYAERDELASLRQR